ncbi:hypothetical protein MHX53_03025 [Brevibacterium sp. ACRRH]|uniref:hypothetical protein n=1 Tax=Brevibacterium sp. ACRRH TaxID=2918183 RepID=UPI001EF513F6|nr:hypothetical protein [Brevibacterium sp. ACRRH]MCG7298031.1 hypothetical protein [Brevibacterium sp. ACRRH]
MYSPAELAGIPRGKFVGPADRRYSITNAVTLLALLFLNVIAGVFKQAPCFGNGYELPGAVFRVCQSPLATALGAPGIPNTDATKQLIATSVFTDYFVRAFGSDGGATIAMMLVVGVNAVAWIVTGCLLFRVFAVVGRQWLVFVFASPMIALTLGQSFDPVGITFIVGAWFLLLERRGESPVNGAPVMAGIAVVVAILVQPFALFVGAALVSWLLWAGRKSDAMSLAGVATILLGLLVMLDAALTERIRQAFSTAVTWGSVGSLVGSRIDHSVLVVLSLVAWVVAVALTVVLLRKDRAGRPSFALLVSVLVGWALLLLPSSPTSLALWALPFFALIVPQVWAHLAWNLAEVALLIAVNLNVAFHMEKATGLSDAWLAFLTIVRLGLVGLMVSYVCSERGDRVRIFVDSEPATSVKPKVGS